MKILRDRIAPVNADRRICDLVRAPPPRFAPRGCDLGCHEGTVESATGGDMIRNAGSAVALRLASAAGEARGVEKYRLLDLKRRRAQIRARRLLGLI